MKGERSRGLVSMVISLCRPAIVVWGVRDCMVRWRSEEKGELRQSVELLGSLSESSCANDGAISEPCVVCAPPKLTSDDGDGDGADRVGSWSTQLIVLFRLAESCNDGMIDVLLSVGISAPSSAIAEGNPE